jgi:hypothetical protein
VVVSSTYPDGMNISFGPSTIRPGVRESLQLLILKDQASIRYALAGGDDSLHLAVDESGTLVIHHHRATPPLKLYFVQPQGKPVILAVRQADAPRLLEGDGLWHLYLADPALVTRELFPLLELMRPSWPLAATGEQIERALLSGAVQPRSSDTGRWKELVDQLGSTQFSEREAAERQLLRAGPRVLPFLRQLDASQLDAEQAARIARLRAELAIDYEDNVDRVANALQADMSVWLSLAVRDDVNRRRLARTQLDLIVGSSVDFDPDADAETREAQLARLRARWLPPPDANAQAEAIKQLESVPPPVEKL